MNRFTAFLSDLHQYDPCLIEAVSDGYYTIFESFTEVSTAVLDAYNQLFNVTIDLIKYEPNNTAIIHAILDGNDINIIIKTGSGMACKAIPPNIISLPISDIVIPLLKYNIPEFKKQISKPKYRYVILHELGHIYEYFKRDPIKLETQIIELKKKQDSKKITDHQYHNDRTEKLANYTSAVIYRILDAVKNGITDPHEMYAYVIDAIQKDSIKTEDNKYVTHMGKTIDSLNHTHTRTLYKRIANIINEITKNNTSDLATITNTVARNLDND